MALLVKRLVVELHIVIKSYCKSHEITVEDFFDTRDMSYRTYLHWLNGRTNPSLFMLTTLLDSMNKQLRIKGWRL